MRIVTNGSLIPNVSGAPLDARTVCESYESLSNIENPYVGLRIWITAANREVVVTSLKSVGVGVFTKQTIGSVENVVNASELSGMTFDPKTSQPIDSRTLFYSLADAKKAAASAERAGSANTVYYYGMHLVVVDEQTGAARQYIIQANKTLKAIPFTDEVGINPYVIGEGLSLNFETNTLSVDKTEVIVEGDNRLATSDAVFQHVKNTVGNVNEVLSKV